MAPAAATDTAQTTQPATDTEAINSFGSGGDDADYTVDVEDVEADSGSDASVDITIESVEDDSVWGWLIPSTDKIDWVELRVEYDEENLEFNEITDSEIGDVEVTEEGDGYIVLERAYEFGNSVGPDELPATIATAEFSVTGAEGETATVEATDDSRVGWGPDVLKDLPMFQHDVDYEPGKIQIGEGDGDDPDPDPPAQTTFDAENTGGFISFNEETEDSARSEGINFPAEGIQIEGEIADDGTWTSTNVKFDTLEVSGFEATVEAPNGLEGEIDPAGNFVTANGELKVSVLGNSFSFEIAATSGDSGALSGSADLSQDGGSATVVDNEYIVDDTTGNVLIDNQLGLPIEESGLNWLELPLEFTITDDGGDDEPETGSLDVSVSDQNGDAIENADVEVDGQTAQTDANGMATFDDLEVGTYDVTATAEGESATTSAEVVANETSSADLTVELPPETGSLEVSVSDQNGDAVENADVEVDGESAQTDANGIATLDNLEVGTYDVTVTAEGETKTVSDVEITADQQTSVDVEIELPADKGSLEVSVTDQNDDPVEGATVEVDGQSAQTDASGVASFSGLDAGDYTVTVSADGVSETASATVDAGATASVGVQLDLTGTLEVSVTDQNGDAVEGATVEVDGQSAQTDASGVASFSGLDAGDYTVSAESDGVSGTTSATVEAGTTTSADIQLGLTGSLEVAVTDQNGDAVEGATVEVDGQSAQTDASGVASFSGLDAGDYTVSAESDGVSGTTSATVEAGSTTSADIQLGLTGSLEVSVTDQNGDAVEGATVEVDGQSAQTDASGMATFSGLAPDDYTVSVSADGVSETASATVDAGATASVDVQLDLTGALEVTVSDQDSNPIADATVEVAGQSAQTDANGVASFSGLDAGNYDITVQAEGETASANADVTAGDTTSVGVTIEVSEAFSFTAKNTGGFISFDEDNIGDAKAEGLDFPADHANNSGIVIKGNAEGGTWNSTTVSFPTLTTGSGFDAQAEAVNGLHGEIDRENNYMTAEGTLKVTLALTGDSFRFNVSLTTGISNGNASDEGLEGSADFAGGSVKLVDNEYIAPNATGNSLLDQQLGLPITDPGLNWLELPFDIQVQEG